MLSNTLNTNEIKNAAGTEVEFQRLSQRERETVFGQISEAPVTPNRLTIKHQESGSGFTKKRRSMFRFDKTVQSTVDTTKYVTISWCNWVEIPVGALTATTEVANVIAQGMSFLASTGANTTILYDCTGNGAATLINGGL